MVNNRRKDAGSKDNGSAKTRKGGWETAGVCYVDTGMLWIGDPAHVLHQRPPEPGDTSGEDGGRDMKKLLADLPPDHTSEDVWLRVYRNPIPKDVGRHWIDFCNRRDERGHGDGTAQFNFDSGVTGLGVVVPTGLGDGEYEVSVRRVDGIVVEARVDFTKGLGA